MKNGIPDETEARRIVEAYAAAFDGTPPREERIAIHPQHGPVTELRTNFTLGGVKIEVSGIVRYGDQGLMQ